MYHHRATRDAGRQTLNFEAHRFVLERLFCHADSIRARIREKIARYNTRSRNRAFPNERPFQAMVTAAKGPRRDSFSPVRTPC